MNTGPSGFHNAPVTRSVVIVSAVFTVLAGMRDRSTTLGLSFQDIKKLNLGRLITSLFAFSSTPELLFGLYLLYYFRVFERQIGSNKYSVFILFSLILSTVFQITSLQLLKDSSLSALASGPYGLIFSSFVPFYFDIPVSTRLNIFRVRFSDKSFIYLAGLQLILSSWKRSLLPGICGIFAGLLYRLNIFHVRRLKFPEAVTSIFARISIPFFSGGTPRSNTAPTVENPGNRTERPARHVEANFAPSAPFASPTVPSEDSIATLESMGFDRNSAREALMQARNDVNAATNILLEAQQHS